jgi:amidase
VTPTSAILPPTAGSIMEAAHANPEAPVADVVASVSFTAFGNVTGLPAASLPLHWTDEGVPVGVQLTAGPWEEATLIRLSSQLEQALPWADRHPAPAAAA